jgi:amidophosphoribosyltransferase
VASIARAIGFDSDQLCQACLTGDYPTPCGEQLYQIALDKVATGEAVLSDSVRTYELQRLAVAARP